MKLHKKRTSILHAYLSVKAAKIIAAKIKLMRIEECAEFTMNLFVSYCTRRKIKMSK